jgi:hypothetical protein
VAASFIRDVRGAQRCAEPIREVPMAPTQKHFVFCSFAAMDGNHDRATRDKAKTLGLVKKMAREMKRRIVTCRSQALEQV